LHRQADYLLALRDLYFDKLGDALSIAFEINKEKVQSAMPIDEVITKFQEHKERGYLTANLDYNVVGEVVTPFVVFSN
jgi:hypothetical protein